MLHRLSQKDMIPHPGCVRATICVLLLWFCATTLAAILFMQNTPENHRDIQWVKKCSSETNKICDKMPGNRKTDVRSLEFILLNYGKLCALAFCEVATNARM